MNQVAPFVITTFTNPSGEIVFRVSGSLDGKRVRKNFPTRAEAEAERQILEVQRAQGETGIRTAITRLTDEQIGEAETLFARAAGLPRPLSFYVDFALTNYREPETQRLLADAVADYTAAKDHEFAQDQISESHLVFLKRDLKRFLRHFPKVTVADLTPERLIGYFNLGKPKLKTYNNRRGIVSTFLKFSFQRGWINANPMAKVPSHRIRRKREAIPTFSATKAAEFMRHIENLESGRFVPFFALCLFAGIRPCLRTGEILRLKPELVNLESGIINITAEVSKVREPRKITIQANLAAWLKAYPLDKFPIIPANLQHVRARIAKAFGLSHDLMRHTFISFFVAKFRSMGEAALQAGNSEAIIRKHYLDLKSQTEAEAFFGIMPKHSATPTVSAQLTATLSAAA
jgi:integrase